MTAYSKTVTFPPYDFKKKTIFFLQIYPFEMNIFNTKQNCIDGVMVSMFPLGAVDRRFKPC